jgi:hypothetical protein
MEGAMLAPASYTLTLQILVHAHLKASHNSTKLPSTTMAQRILPSERTIAFAAAVVSSKPADLTVRGKLALSAQSIHTHHDQLTPPTPEYITLLTRHVATGRRENALSAAYRHLDRSAYWRAECERAKTDLRAAEEAKLDALREVDVLKSKLEIAKMAMVAGSKRKRQDADVVPYSREVKKGRKEAEEKREVFLGGLVIEEVDAGEGDEGGEFSLLVAGGGQWLRKTANCGQFRTSCASCTRLGCTSSLGCKSMPKIWRLTCVHLLRTFRESFWKHSSSRAPLIIHKESTCQRQ